MQLERLTSELTTPTKERKNICEMYYFFNWVVVDSYGNVISHISDGYVFCLFGI